MAQKHWPPPETAETPEIEAANSGPNEADGHYGGGHGGGGGDRWLVSYSDFITVMMIVGFVLFAISNQDKAKTQKLAASLNAAFGGTAMQQGLEPIPQQSLPGQPIPIAPLDRETGYMPDIPDWPAQLIAPEIAEPPQVVPVEKPPVNAAPVPGGTYDPPAPPPKDELQGLKDAFAATPGGKTGLLSVALQERGLVISVAGSVLFDPGKTTLKPGAASLLDSVANKLKGVEMPVMVEGTGDSTAVGAMDQWDLASLRAGSVIRYLVGQHGLNGSQFVAIGHSSTESNSDGRVHIIVLRKQ